MGAQCPGEPRWHCSGGRAGAAAAAVVAAVLHLSVLRPGAFPTLPQLHTWMRQVPLNNPATVPPVLPRSRVAPGLLRGRAQHQQLCGHLPEALPGVYLPESMGRLLRSERRHGVPGAAHRPGWGCALALLLVRNGVGLCTARGNAVQRQMERASLVSIACSTYQETWTKWEGEGVGEGDRGRGTGGGRGGEGWSRQAGPSPAGLALRHSCRHPATQRRTPPTQRTLACRWRICPGGGIAYGCARVGVRSFVHQLNNVSWSLAAACASASAIVTTVATPWAAVALCPPFSDRGQGFCCTCACQLCYCLVLLLSPFLRVLPPLQGANEDRIPTRVSLRLCSTCPPPLCLPPTTHACLPPIARACPPTHPPA